jgi:DNA-binding transcriptional MocR family regulator
LNIVTVTSWTPDLRRHSGPRYLAIAQALGEDVASGRLERGARLPTHRDLALQLGVTVGTVSRAYAEAERRGLIAGEVGRGTYVRDPAVPVRHQMPARIEADGLIDLAFNSLAIPEDEEALRHALAAIAQQSDAGTLLRYAPHAGLEAHRRAGAAWLGRFGVDAPAERTIITAGGQHAMAVILAALVEPGEMLAVERFSYPGIVALARLLRVPLEGVAMDEHGAMPDSLDQLCRRRRVRGFYTMPNLHNPTAGVMPAARRAEIAEVARRHGITVIEDDVYGCLIPDAPPPLTTLLPDQSIYFTSVSKSLSAGLRVGYALPPPMLHDRLVMAVRSFSWMAAPLNAEIATRWIDDGTADRLVMARRREVATRQAMIREVLAGASWSGDPRAAHIWLHLPLPWRAAEFAVEARRRGVLLVPADTFAINGDAPPNDVRICLGGPLDRTSFRRGLEVVATLLRGAPGPDLSIL